MSDISRKVLLLAFSYRVPIDPEAREAAHWALVAARSLAAGQTEQTEEEAKRARLDLFGVSPASDYGSVDIAYYASWAVHHDLSGDEALALYCLDKVVEIAQDAPIVLRQRALLQSGPNPNSQ